MGKNFNSPNDLVAHSSGTIFFSNPTYESISMNGFGQAAFWISPTGTVTLLAMGGSNGVALSPDEKTLYVSGMGTWTIDANGAPVTGSRTNNDPGGDGISVNCANKRFTPATNSCFGGPDGKTMLIVSGTGGNLHVDTVQMMVPGIP
jgi:sugar lactone lactonase YvrE